MRIFLVTVLVPCSISPCSVSSTVARESYKLLVAHQLLSSVKASFVIFSSSLLDVGMDYLVWLYAMHNCLSNHPGCKSYFMASGGARI
jgi:hypothetical protein